MIFPEVGQEGIAGEQFGRKSERSDSLTQSSSAESWFHVLNVSRGVPLAGHL